MSIDEDSILGSSVFGSSNELQISVTDTENPICDNCSNITDIPCRSETWAAEGTRRHWVLKSHCELLHFPNQYPNLALPSKLGRFLWQQHRANLKPNATCIRDILRCATATLNDMVLYCTQLEQIIICDSLMDLSWFDAARRKSFTDQLNRFLGMQNGLVMVSFENCRMKRMEGTEALLSLGLSSGLSLQYLYLWQMFTEDENPVLRDTTFCQFREKGAFKASASCKLSFWRSLLRFRSLSVLAINYSYLADTNGHTLCMLASILTNSLTELQVLCLEEDCPDKHPANDFDGGFTIPDAMWDQASTYCPRMRVYIVIVTVPRYEDIVSFLSRSSPVHHLYISSGFVVSSQKLWHIDCTLKTLFYWYPQTLNMLCLHLWHNREQLDSLLIQAFDKLPMLQVLEFSGKLHSLKTINTLCNKLDSGSYCMQRLSLTITGMCTTQDIECGVVASTCHQIQQTMDEAKEHYECSLQESGIVLDLKTQLCF